MRRGNAAPGNVPFIGGRGIVETTIFSAYNEGSQRVLSPRLIVVDASREPLKVLKILMQGLAPNARNGIWLTNFKGVPIARAASAFDLLYLDEQHQVLHAAEISDESEFKPFKGQPASALVLQARTISRSKTFTGDRIAVIPIDERTGESSEATGKKHASQPRSQVVPAFAAKTFNVPSESGAGGRLSSGVVSGRLMRRGKRDTGSILGLQPPVPIDVAPNLSSSAERPDDKVIPIADPLEPSASADPVETQKTFTSPAPRAIAPVPAAADAPTTTKQPLITHSFPPAKLTLGEQVTPSLELNPGKDELRTRQNAEEARPAHADSLWAVGAPSIDDVVRLPGKAASAGTMRSEMPAVRPHRTPVQQHRIEAVTPTPSKAGSLSGTPTEQPAARQVPRKDEREDSPRADTGRAPRVEPPAVKRIPVKAEPPVLARETNARAAQGSTQLVQTAERPALAPSAKSPWDIRLLYRFFPELDPGYRPDLEGDIETGKLSKKVVSWIYPSLDLENVEKKQRSHRRAPRIPEPGLVGYYFAGGPASPHLIRNLSVMGFYMVTDQRWMPGTVIRVTLQIIDSPGDDPRDTLTVLSRVVNWGPDGGGFEFVMPGFD